MLLLLIAISPMDSPALALPRERDKNSSPVTTSTPMPGPAPCCSLLQCIFTDGQSFESRMAGPWPPEPPRFLAGPMSAAISNLQSAGQGGGEL